MLELAQVCHQSPQVCNSLACSVTNSCTPGQFTLQLTIVAPSPMGDAQPDIPTMIGMDLSLDGAELVNETIAPMVTTATTQPNGAGCGTCTSTNATATVTIENG
jgi:hypothetical protein